MRNLSPRGLHPAEAPVVGRMNQTSFLPPYGASQLGETPELSLMVGLTLFTINIIFPGYISREMLGNRQNCIKSITSFPLKAEKKALTS